MREFSCRRDFHTEYEIKLIFGNFLRRNYLLKRVKTFCIIFLIYEEVKKIGSKEGL